MVVEGREHRPNEIPVVTNLHWYACRTRSQHEGVVERQIRERALPVEVLLPRYRVTKQWHDRKKVLEPLLFPGYVFLRSEPELLARVSWCVGFAGWISFQGKPSVIPNSEIEVLYHAVDLDPRPVSSFHAGERVRVIRGLLAGAEGTIERIKGGCRLVLRLVGCMPSLFSVEVDEADCQLVEGDYASTWQRP